MIKAIYKCLKCECVWKQMAAMVQCPKCQHFYVEWTNYKEDFVKKFSS